MGAKQEARLNAAIGTELRRHIYDKLEDGSTILELGSGEGTALLSSSYNMISIESEPDWVGRYNSEYIHAPIRKESGWYNPVPIEKANLHKRGVHAILIDGPRGIPPTARLGILQYLDLFPWDDVFVWVDDTHRKHERELAERLGDYLTIKPEYHQDGSKEFAFLW